jgi:hypothetical protein
VPAAQQGLDYRLLELVAAALAAAVVLVQPFAQELVAPVAGLS